MAAGDSELRPGPQQSGTLRGWRSGAQNPIVSRTLPQTDWPLAIGNRSAVKRSISYLPPMVGRIDEVAIFRRALSAEQVKEMYLAEKPG